jgi:hypothetical protein
MRIDVSEAGRGSEPELPLSGGHLTQVRRVGDTVRRARSEWSPAVEALLVELRGVGFEGCPEFLGVDEHGRQVLSWIEGQAASGSPLPAYVWSDGSLLGVVSLLRELHDASVSLVGQLRGFAWQEMSLAPALAEVVCHNDCAPWNTVFRGGAPIAFLDWDLAAPGSRLWDVAYAAWHWIPLWVDERAVDHGFSDLEGRPRRLRLLADAYRLAAPDRRRLLDFVELRQRAWAQTVRRGAAQGVEEYVRLERAGAGDLTDLVWLEQQRGTLSAALTA